MKKLVLLTFLMVAGLTATFAQGRFSAGLELGLPLGTFGDAANIGIGATARYEAPIQDKLNWTATLGYLSFGAKGTAGTGVSASYSIIPIHGGIKYYFTESFNGFYASAALGLSIVGASASGYGQSYSSSSTKFAFAPGVGYHLGNLDFSGSFQIISDLNYFNIRAAYVFGGK